MTQGIESNNLTVCPGLSISAQHRPIYDDIVETIRKISDVRSIGGHSDGNALLVALIVHTNDEDVWDRLSDIEFDVSKEHPGMDIAFRECDSFSESEVQFMHDLPPALLDEFASAAS